MVSPSPSNLRRRINSDEALAKIARELTGWTAVRPFSGLSSVDEETIRTNYRDIQDQRFQFLREWKKKNPNGNLQDLAEMFRLAERMDMVEITCKVVGEETEQDEGINRKRDLGMHVKQHERVDDGETSIEHNKKVNSKLNKGTAHKAHCSRIYVVLATVLTVLLAGCAYFVMRWAVGDDGMTTSGVDTVMKMAASREGEEDWPPFPLPFVGRDENMSYITNMLLLDPRIRGVRITGPPAIGKSHLAVQVCYKLVEHGVNIRYIDMSKYQFLKDLKKHFSSQEQDHYDTSDSVSSLFKWARGLNVAGTLLLDNCDEVLQGAPREQFFDLIQKLLKTSKYMKFISTSRDLYTLVGVKHFPLGTLEEKSSIDLLQQECKKFQVEEAKVVADLVGYNPLGLRLAANLACDVISVKELIESLRANPVKTLSSDTMSDKEKMERVIETSIKYLEEEVVLCAKNISLFPGSFSKEAGVTILCGCGVEDAVYCLNTLSHKSLLEWYVVGEVSRYKYHRLIRDSFISLENTHHFSNESDLEETFFEQYSMYFITSINKTLEECEIDLSEYCEYWIHNEELNTRFVLKAILRSSPRRVIQLLLYWKEILKDPTFFRLYSKQAATLIIWEMEVIRRCLQQAEVQYVSFVVALQELSYYFVEWDVYLVLVALISSLLISKFKTLLQGHGNSATSSVRVNILAFTASLLASTKPALYIAWLVQFSVSYVPPIANVTTLLAISVAPVLIMGCVMIKDFRSILYNWFFFLIMLINFWYPHTVAPPILLLPLIWSLSLNVSFIFDVQLEFCFNIHLLFGNLYYNDFICPPVLLSKIIVVLLSVWMVGLRSLLCKPNVFLIILVVCGDHHFLSTNHISFLSSRTR